MSPNYPSNYPSCYTDRVDVFQGKKGSKVKLDIASFDLDFSDLILVFEGTPSYKDVKEIFSTAPGCPPPNNRNSPKKNKKQLRKIARDWIDRIKQNQIVFGFEFLAVSLM